MRLSLALHRSSLQLELKEGQEPVQIQSAVVLAGDSGTAAPHRHRELPVDCGGEENGWGQSRQGRWAEL